MATTDFDLDQYIDNSALDAIERETWEHDREQEAQALHNDLAISLPDDPAMRKEAFRKRGDFFDNLRVLNNKLTPQPGIKTANLHKVEVTDRRWMAYPFLPESEVTLLTGQGGAGKSFLLLQIGGLFAAGYTDAELTQKELVGSDPYHYFIQPGISPDPDHWSEPQSVVYASYEDDMSEIRRRMNTLYNRFDWFADKQSTIFDNFHPVSMRAAGCVWGPEIGKHYQTRSQPTRAADQLKSFCEDRQAKLLMIDPLSAAFYGDENNKAEVYAFVHSWAEWGEANGTAVLISGHLPKSRESRRSGYSGTAAWEGAVRSLFTLDRFDMNENEDGEREKGSNNKNLPRKWYLAIKGIKGNYAPTDKVEIPVIRGEYGWIETTGETDIGEAKEFAHQCLNGNKPQRSTSNTTQEGTDDAYIPKY